MLQSEPCAELQSLCRSASGRADLLLLLLLVQCLGKGNFCSPPSGTSTPLSSPQPPPGTPPSPPPALWGSIPGRPAGEMRPCGFNGAALSAFSLLRSPASTAASPASTGASPGLFGGVLGVSELGPPLPAASPSVPPARPRGARSRARGRYRLPTASRSPTGDAQRSLCSPYPSTSCVFIFLSFYFYFYFFLEAPMSLVLAVRGVIAQPQSTKIHLDANAWWQLGVSIHKNTGF